MNQITIFGGTGMVGRRLLQKAGEKNIRVKVLARDKGKIQNLQQNLDIIEGDYFDKDKLKLALEGSGAIISTIGPDIHDHLTSKEEDNYILSLAYIIEQMHENHQSRWINISCAGVKRTNENMPLARKLLRMKLMAISKSIITIKERELQMLEKSDLDWTSVRSPLIREDIKGTFAVDEKNFVGNMVDLNQLGDFMLTEITKNNWIKNAPVVGTK